MTFATFAIIAIAQLFLLVTLAAVSFVMWREDRKKQPDREDGHVH